MMNIIRWMNRGWAIIKETMESIRNRCSIKKEWMYIGFVLVVTLCSVSAAELSSYGKLKTWYYDLTNKEIINKGIFYADEKKEEGLMRGQFLTYYRYEEFGVSNPDEIDKTAPMVALTFDDGPNPEYTQQILDVLKANYSYATFFVVGTNAEKYPEVLQNILSAGSEIGNHTYHHKNLTEADTDTIEQEISGVNRAVKSATGEKATLIRPPYGAYDDTVMSMLTEPVVLWDMDTEDWKSRNAKVIADKVLSEVKDGDIILMHDIYDSTAQAVEQIVPRLKEMGYQIVSVSQMAAYKGKTLDLGKPYGEIDGVSEQ